MKQKPCILGGKSFTTSPNRENWAGSSSKGIFFKLLLSSSGNANLDKKTYQSVIGLISASAHILGMQDANIGLNVDIKRILARFEAASSPIQCNRMLGLGRDEVI